MVYKQHIMLDGVDILKEKINMCFILLLNKLETPETIEQTIYEHLDAFVKEWNDALAHKTQECEELKNNLHIANTNHEAAEKECDRYRKALEEIEKVCIEYTREFADGATVHYYSLDEIFDIINKAKVEKCMINISLLKV